MKHAFIFLLANSFSQWAAHASPNTCLGDYLWQSNLEVPTGVTSLTIEARGAEGNTNRASTVAADKGAIKRILDLSTGKINWEASLEEPLVLVKSR